MRKVCALLLLVITVACTQPANAQISIGINLTVFPNLVIVPGYPVYYAPTVTADYFFYDGFYWVFNVEDGQWYSSSWYNGPWVFVEPLYVPQPILVIPFRYYRVRPAYWGGWAYDAPPRWGQHWGYDWESRRAGWDRWDRGRATAAAPLPLYQREYPRDRYPAPSQQVIIHNERYKYQAHDTVVQQQRASIFRQQSSGGMKATAKAERVDHPQGSAARERPQRQESAQPPPARSPRQETTQPPAAPRHEAPAVERAQPERGRRPEPQRVEPQPNAPREQAGPQQAPRGERPPARLPAQPPPVQPQPPQHPKEERQQPERGPEGHPQEGQGQGHR